MTREEKAKVIAGLTESFSNSQGIVVCDFKGLNVKKLEELRNNAREKNIKVQVIKNTFANIALKNSNKDGLELKDTNIFLWGETLDVCKVAAKFDEGNENFSVKKAYLDGEAPIQNFTIGLNALKDKKEQSA